MYQTVVQMTNGPVIWAYLKPLIMGKILYSPDTPATRTLIQKVRRGTKVSPHSWYTKSLCSQCSQCIAYINRYWYAYWIRKCKTHKENYNHIVKAVQPLLIYGKNISVLKSIYYKWIKFKCSDLFNENINYKFIVQIAFTNTRIISITMYINNTILFSDVQQQF